ncbi:pyruvate kinase [Burkholderia sp. AU33423]|uniref:Pyruvate kinase n=1 Tax=Burkholderia contaminans TaxID=488447 RepID=A0A6P2Y8E4_9BURK|nr:MULTISPECIES: pyruvate kinase [Burkholderia]OXI78819.1 pyruvate kinase [Burkholderia sp. AU33423]OXJ26244.1 pyruvate kinase [Burkholderia sp. HI2714]VWD17934.1 pyruvate kinase [Burkholderia contaminans]
MSKTTIIATIGPASNTTETLLALHRAGMTVARLNGSHGSLDWHRATIELIRRTLPDLPILLDIPGRKIRTVQLRTEPSFEVGGRLVLTTDLSHDGSSKVPVNYDRFHLQLRAGVRIYADDGTLSFVVEAVRGQDVHVVAETAGTLKSRKGINVPEVDLGQQLVTPRDREMVAFAKHAGVDFVGISFVESAAHVAAIRALIDAPSPRIVAKVENQGGLDHLDEIAGATDVIMIDRGDLSVETSIDHVSLYQKRIIAAARQHGRPVIVATELLHSMIESPLPTKAEIGDVTNAVIDGASAVMLSGETAVGKFPVEAVARLRSIVTLAEAHRHASLPAAGGLADAPNDLRAATLALTRTLPISKVVVLSRTGYAARLVSMAQVRQPVIAVGRDAALARSWNLLPGTTAVFLPDLDLAADGAGTAALKSLWEGGRLQVDDVVLVVLAASDDAQASLSSLQTVRVGQLAAQLAWSVDSGVEA